MPPCHVAWNYPVFLRAMPDPGVGYPRLTAPYAGSPHCWGFVRLACLIHAANVRSEPGSNPSKVSARAGPKPGALIRRRPAERKGGGVKDQPERFEVAFTDNDSKNRRRQLMLSRQRLRHAL